MQLNGQQQQQLHKALLKAFPHVGKLTQMVRFGLDQNLNAIAGGQDQSEIVFSLIQWAEAEGKLEQLIAAAVDANPGNPHLQNFLQQVQLKSSIEESSISKNIYSIRTESFTKLSNLLQTGNWKKADQETELFLCQLANTRETGLIRIEDIEKLSCEDLRMLDQLWVNFSQGKFGFSVQRDIWYQSREDDKQFYKAVGWYADDQWKSYSALTFDLSAPKGHLPTLWASTKVLGGFRNYFFARVRKCMHK